MITLGNKNELFLDDTMIDSGEGLVWDVVRPERHGCVFRYDAPWEGPHCGYPTLICHPETGRIYLYYRGALETANNQVTCLAVSDDGEHFERVDTGLHNIVLSNVEACHNFAPFYDTNPACREDERFKAMGIDHIDAGNGDKKPVLKAYASPDGIRWKPLSEEPVITDGAFDSLNTAFWDSVIKKYRCYSRYMAGKDSGRAIQSCESDDFIHWTPQKHNTYNGGKSISYEFYTNATRPIPGAEHQYLAIPMRFAPDRKKVEKHPHQGVSDCVLITSRDGYDWVLRDGRPWVYAGIDERLWTQRNFIFGAGVVEKDDRFHFYSGEHHCWDDSGLFHYSVPKHRLGYVYGLNGSFVTKPFLFRGTRLTFNYNTSGIGTLSVKVLTEDGEPIEGYECAVYGNELAYPLEMKELEGRTLRLSVRLEDAYLYSVGY